MDCYCNDRPAGYIEGVRWDLLSASRPGFETRTE